MVLKYSLAYLLIRYNNENIKIYDNEVGNFLGNLTAYNKKMVKICLSQCKFLMD